MYSAGTDPVVTVAVSVTGVPGATGVALALPVVCVVARATHEMLAPPRPPSELLIDTACPPFAQFELPAAPPPPDPAQNAPLHCRPALPPVTPPPPPPPVPRTLPAVLSDPDWPPGPEADANRPPGPLVYPGVEPPEPK